MFQNFSKVSALKWGEKITFQILARCMVPGESMEAAYPIERKSGMTDYLLIRVQKVFQSTFIAGEYCCSSVCLRPQRLEHDNSIL